MRFLKRQAPVLVIVIAAVCVAAGAATGDPSISSKRAQAQQVMQQITQLDAGLQRARNLYYASTQRLHVIEHNLRDNKVALRAARANLRASQRALMQRLVTIYTTRDDQSTLAVILGARSIDDLVNRIEAVQSVSSQDVAVMNQVIHFKHAVTAHERALVRAHRTQQRVVQQRAAAQTRISSQISRARDLYASIRNEIAQIVQQQHARQLALEQQATARLAVQQPQQAQVVAATPVGVSASDGTATVAPPSQYTGVVGIAMRYLGTPYVYGGESPAGFDCSGLVAYVYAQVGVSLPHYTGAQWGMGVPVDRADLEPGDLVFFDGLGHVGIYIGGNEFIHAPHTGDVGSRASRPPRSPAEARARAARPRRPASATTRSRLPRRGRP
jgi:cell wall-associated NlpC family hydrolase